MSDMILDTRSAVGSETVQVSRSDLFVVFMLATGHDPVEGGLTPFALERIAAAIGGCVSDSTAVELAQPVEIVETERTPFEEFWELYPRKTGKLAAAKAFEKAAKLVGERKILAAAWDYHHHCKGTPRDRKRFLPHPTTWLNQGRWDDELDPDEHASPSKVAETRSNLVDGLDRMAHPTARDRLANRQAALEAGGL